MGEPEAPGWVVLDPDGNIVDSGPGLVLTMATQMGEPQQEEEATDGGD